MSHGGVLIAVFMARMGKNHGGVVGDRRDEPPVEGGSLVRFLIVMVVVIVIAWSAGSDGRGVPLLRQHGGRSSSSTRPVHHMNEPSAACFMGNPVLK